MSGIWNPVGNTFPYTIKGHWDASTNTPDITTVTQEGYAYVVSVAGTFDLGGITQWEINDIAVKTLEGWVKITASGNALWGTINGTLSDQTDLSNALGLKANSNAVVALIGNQTVAGIKTFSSSPIVPTPTTDMQASTKKYADDGLALKQDKPTSSVENNLAIFDDANNTKDSGVSIVTSITGTPSDLEIPTEKAITTALALKQDRPATATENNIATFNTTKDTKDSGKEFTTSLGNPGVDTKIPTEKSVRTALQITDNLLYNELGNGIKSGGTLSINTNNTKFNISATKGIIIDNTNPVSPILTSINYAGQTGITVENLATANASYIALDSSGNIIQQTTEFTPIQRRSLLILGVVVHSNRTFVNAVNNLPDVALSPTSQLNDFFDSLKNFNISGNIISANGANLNINKSLGYIFKRGVNFNISNLNPHKIQLNASEAPNTIRYRLQDGTEYADTAVIDPNYYDLNGVRTPVSPNKFTIQRIALFPSNLIRIQYGQNLYNSKSDAIQAISTESFVEEDNIAENGLLRSLLVVKQGTTDLTNMTNAQFFEADKFGSTKFSAGGTGTTTLQQAYDNSIKPQIITTAESGSVQYKGNDSENTLEVLNLTDEIVSSFSNTSQKFGNITNNNYSEIESDGTLSFHGDATVFKDISLSGLMFAPGGSAAPSLISFVNANCLTYGFNGSNTTERLYITTEMNHDYKEGSELELHVHWTPTTANTGNVKWQLYYTWQSKDGTFGTPQLLTAISSARGTAWQNTYETFGTISGVGKTINSQLVLQIFRVPTDGDDTYPDNAALVALGIHYECDTVGSRQRLSKL